MQYHAQPVAVGELPTNPACAQIYIVVSPASIALAGEHGLAF